MLPSARTYAFWLALLRIYMGLFWIEHGLGKVLAHPAFGAAGGPMAQFVGDQLQKTSGTYHDFLAGVVAPNLTQFAIAVEFGELAAGTLLLLGLFSRFGGALGVLLALNYWAAKGQFGGFSPYAGLDILAAAGSALHVVLPTGRFFGLDALAARRRVPAARTPSRPPNARPHGPDSGTIPLPQRPSSPPPV